MSLFHLQQKVPGQVTLNQVTNVHHMKVGTTPMVPYRVSWHATVFHKALPPTQLQAYLWHSDISLYHQQHTWKLWAQIQFSC